MRTPCPAAVAVLLLAAAPLAAQTRLAARALSDASEVYVGQPFLYQIDITGSDRPERPDLSDLEDNFNIEPAGEGANNSTQISIVNGRMSRVETKGYQFNYRLSPKHEGRMAIPAITVRAEGQEATTNPLPIRVLPPEEITDFKLRMSLAERTAYVGQPVMLTTTWYVGRSVDQFRFQAPLLEDERLEVLTPRAAADPAQQVDIPLGDGRVTARRGRGRIDGFEFLTVSFDQVVVPKQAGALSIDPTVVSFRSIREGVGGRSFLDAWGFGDPFLNRGRSYENLSVPANRVTLEVLPLPERGRPADFSGLIGAFDFEATATPADVSVGDPITLEIRVSGPEYLEYVRLPDLEEDSTLRRDFQISSETSSEMRADAKVFTRTIRARNPSIQGVPPLEFNYFDPRTGAYETARTKAIPLEIRGTRVLTAADAEGVGIEQPLGEVAKRSEGIGHQYEGADALVSQPAGPAERLASPLWLGALALPPAAFLALLGWKRSQGIGADSPERRKRRAARDFEAAVAGLDSDVPDRLLDALRAYLGSKLDRPGGALTFVDVRGELARRGVTPSALHDLEDAFRHAEAGRYGGGTGGASERRMLEQARSAVRGIEEALR